MIDLHCHILPYVDDGASTKDIALKMLRIASEQNIQEIYLTPHLRMGMFETPDDEIVTRFEKLCQLASENGLSVRLHLSREYHVDKNFYRVLSEGNLIPIGENTLLMEYSGEHSFEDILKSASLVLESGYRPLIAHSERCRAFQGDTKKVRELVESGCLIQINADSVLGNNGFFAKRFCTKLIRQDLVFAVASDAHGETYRPLRMQKCYEMLKKKFGQDMADRLTFRNPAEIIKMKETEACVQPGGFEVY